MRERADDPTIAALVTTAQAGDRLAWEEIVERYGGMVQAVVSSFRLQEADAADAVQNTWLRAVERLGALREPERFGGWLKTIAYRECLALRAHARREYLDEAIAEHIADQSPGPEAEALRAEMCRAVRAAVDTLTGRRRVLVESLFYRPCSDYSLAAHTAGMPVGSIGPTRARAMRTLHAQLEQTGFGPGSAVAAPVRTG